MLKKIYRLFKFVILSMVWTLVFLNVARVLIYYGWSFNILSVKQWNMIVQYWNSDGVISGFSDISFFVVLLVALVLWLYGLRKVNEINYLRLFMKPLEYIANRDLKKYEKQDTRIVIKNISVGEKITVEDIIKNKIKQEKINMSKDADSLRQSISEKIIQSKEQ